MEEFIKKVWGRLKSWWGALFALATGHFGHALLERLGNFDLLKDVLSWFGVSTDMILTFILGPEFSLLAACVGLFGMIFLEKPDFKTTHPASQVVGAVVSVAFASTIGGALTFEKLLNTPKFSEVFQYYNDSGITRFIAPTTSAEISEYLKSTPDLVSDSKANPIYIASTADNNSIDYEIRLCTIFNNNGLNVRPVGSPGSQDPGEIGVMIELLDVKHPSKEANQFMSMLMFAHIFYRKEVWSTHEGWPPLPDFMVFITRDEPVPIN